MAKIGCKYIAGSPITSEVYGALPTYGTGFEIGKMISAEVSIETNDNPLYANDVIVENDRSFSSGTISLNVDDFGDTPQQSFIIQEQLLPVKIVEIAGVDVLRFKGSIESPYIGIGFIKVRKLRGAKYYVATWLYKVQFAVPTDSTTTKGQSIEWQTPTIEGKIMTIDGYDDDVYKDEANFTDLGEAVNWIKEIGNISTTVDKTTLTASITSAEAMDPELYTSVSWAYVAIALVNANAVKNNTYATQTQVNNANTALSNAVSALVEV